MLVFVSHSRENSSVALGLCRELGKRRVQTWLDIRDLGPGTSWEQEVAEAVKRADAFVFVIGPPGPPDRWQRYEWERVLDSGYYLDSSRPLIPVVIGAAEIPGFLKVRKTISVEPENPNLTAVADHVVAALRQGSTIDPKKYQRAIQARNKALKQVDRYAEILETQERKRAGMRPLE